MNGFSECCSASFTEDGRCGACGQPDGFWDFDLQPPYRDRDEGGEG